MFKAILVLLALTAVVSAKVYFNEKFDTDAFADGRWVQSTNKADYGKLVTTAGKTPGDAEIAKGLQTSEDAKFYAAATKFPEAISNTGKDLVISFSVKFEQGIDCGGGYLKFLPDMDPKGFNGDSEYFIMFGPDVCGYNKKIHVIFGYNGKNLLWKKEPRCEDDKLTHVYTLVVKPDNTYKVLVDNQVKESGSLEEDWDFLAKKKIDDPNDKKPSDWVDEAEIDDPSDSKPADWDTEPATIPDENAKQPEDWDESEDGKWEAPNVPNPKHKGEWRAKRIPNPKYKGEWKPAQIDNPDYKEDANLYQARKPLQYVGVDVWQVKSGTIFDNIIIGDDLEEVNALVEKTWKVNHDAEKANEAKAGDKKDDDADKPTDDEEEKKDDDKEDL